MTLQCQPSSFHLHDLGVQMQEAMGLDPWNEIISRYMIKPFFDACKKKSISGGRELWGTPWRRLELLNHRTRFSLTSLLRGTRRQGGSLEEDLLYFSCQWREFSWLCVGLAFLGQRRPKITCHCRADCSCQRGNSWDGLCYYIVQVHAHVLDLLFGDKIKISPVNNVNNYT